jgi:hypothetical protein
LSKNFWGTCRCSHHHEESFSGRRKFVQQGMNATLTATVKESALSCEACMHVMAIMMQCNLSKLSRIKIPTHTKLSLSYFSISNLNVD